MSSATFLASMPSRRATLLLLLAVACCSEGRLSPRLLRCHARPKARISKALTVRGGDVSMGGIDWRYFVAGGASAAISHGYTTPIDVVKTRMQTNPEKYDGSVLAAAKAIVADEGAAFLLQGLTPTVLGYGLEGALKFGFYEVDMRKRVFPIWFWCYLVGLELRRRGCGFCACRGSLAYSRRVSIECCFCWWLFCVRCPLPGAALQADFRQPHALDDDQLHARLRRCRVRRLRCALPCRGCAHSDGRRPEGAGGPEGCGCGRRLWLRPLLATLVDRARRIWERQLRGALTSPVLPPA